MKPVEEFIPYKVAAFLDAHPGQEFDMYDLMNATTPPTDKGSINSALLTLIAAKSARVSGVRQGNYRRQRYLYMSEGNAVSAFLHYREQVVNERNKKEPATKYGEALPHHFIQAALAAHPLHSWRGTH